MNTATTEVATVNPALDTPQNNVLRNSTSSMLAEAQALVIDSNDMYEIAADSTKTIKDLAKRVEAQRKAITEPLDKAKKATMDFFRPFAEALEQAESELKRKMVGYVQEENRKRREEEAAALKRAEEQRRAEQARIEAERQAALAAAAEKIEAGDIAAAEELAQKVEDAEFEAASIASAPVFIDAPAVSAPKAKGIAMVDKWTAEVTDFAALVKHVAATPALIELLSPNETALRKMAEALKGAAKIPGVKVTNNPIARVGR